MAFLKPMFDISFYGRSKDAQNKINKCENMPKQRIKKEANYNIKNKIAVTIDNIKAGMHVLNQHQDLGEGVVIDFSTYSNTCTVEFNDAGGHRTQNIGNNGQYDLIINTKQEKNETGIKVQRNLKKVSGRHRRRGSSIQSRTGRIKCQISNKRNQKITLSLP